MVGAISSLSCQLISMMSQTCSPTQLANRIDRIKARFAKRCADIAVEAAARLTWLPVCGLCQAQHRAFLISSFPRVEPCRNFTVLLTNVVLIESLFRTLSPLHELLDGIWVGFDQRQ